MINQIVDIWLLVLLVITALAVVRLRNLFAATMLFGMYSLLMAAIFVILDAVDVAFTEAAVGAGISTVLFLGTLSVTGGQQEYVARHVWPALLVCGVVGVLLIIGTWDMPLYGDPTAAVHGHVSTRYLFESGQEIGIPNVVTSVLASYRGYDTLGEVTVIFTAGVAVMCLLKIRPK